MRLKISFLKGMIESQKQIIDIKSKSGIYNVSLTEKDKDEGYLKGLEDALEVFKI